MVANTIKGLPLSEAEATLLIHPRRASYEILKLLRSAAANAKNNQHLDAEKLFVKDVRVDQGPMLKRFTPRAMGRATPIQKKTSHITLILAEAETPKQVRFKIAKKERIKKTAKVTKAKKEKEPQKSRAEEKTRVVKEPGFMRRIFRRKSI